MPSRNGAAARGRSRSSRRPIHASACRLRPVRAARFRAVRHDDAGKPQSDPGVRWAACPAGVQDRGRQAQHLVRRRVPSHSEASAPSSTASKTTVSPRATSPRRCRQRPALARSRFAPGASLAAAVEPDRGESIADLLAWCPPRRCRCAPRCAGGKTSRRPRRRSAAPFRSADQDRLHVVEPSSASSHSPCWSLSRGRCRCAACRSPMLQRRAVDDGRMEVQRHRSFDGAVRPPGRPTPPGRVSTWPFSHGMSIEPASTVAPAPSVISGVPPACGVHRPQATVPLAPARRRAGCRHRPRP